MKPNTQRHRDLVELSAHALEGMLSNPESLKSMDKTPRAAVNYAEQVMGEIERAEGRGR